MSTLPPRILIIAGSDSSGGAGIQTDISVARHFGVYPATAVSCVTSQNSHGVRYIEPVSDRIFHDQIISTLGDYMPEAVKIGMLCSFRQVDILAEILERYPCKNVILDPIMAPTMTADPPSNYPHTERKASSRMWSRPDQLKKLGKYTTLVTPNLPEMNKQIHLATSIDTQDFPDAGLNIYMKLYGFRNVLLKGGHARQANSSDILACEKNGVVQYTAFTHPRIDTPNTHGTGCTLSSAIASLLACGKDLHNAVALASEFIGKLLDFNKEMEFYPPGHYGPTCIKI